MIFDRKLSNSVKGIAIIWMLLHHLFAPEILKEGIVDTAPFSFEKFSCLCGQLKICVAIFVFITAFGITRWFKKVQPQKDKLFGYSLSRCFKLECNFLIIYILGLIGHILFGEGILEIYNVNDNCFVAVLYALIDAMGLNTQFGTPSLNATWWYMSIAHFMIFLIPVLVVIYERIGRLLPVIVLFVGIPHPHLNPYFFALVMGIFSAQDNFFERTYDVFSQINSQSVKKFIRGLEFMGCVFAVLLLIYLRRQTNLTYYIDGIIPFFVCYACMILKDIFSFLHSVLEFIGMYSMNIFFIHTFIYFYFFKEFIYWSKNWMLIFMTLLAVCLLVSVIIECIKKWSGFYSLIGTISKRIEEGDQKLHNE
ncbi:MAG: hypothetical protein K2J90_01895 [Lachnospiraceae bacterium]|nr:hypothetical protein [Lachnospiraceae bacterium]